MSQRRVMVIRDFGAANRKRTGLHPRVVLDVEDFEAPDGSVWVKCPEVTVKRPDGFFLRSDGYTILEPGEFREVG